MCGIAGIFSSKPVAESLVMRMLDAIGYRGPDHREARAYVSRTGACLTVGQARLAIIDLNPEANQPFESNDGGTSLTFNGEFYNFLALRQELDREGFRLRTRSDTEVALALLDRHGAMALERLWGMFAGAYFRRDTGRLLLFRDRFGKKPLYLYPHGGRLYFASEPKAILTVLDHTPEPDAEALATFFYLGYIPDQMCAFRGMFKLPAGAYLDLASDQIDAAHEATATWYRPDSEPAPAEADLEAIFMDAVEKRMIADVPLAAFLSGGLDSSLVVAAMSRISRRPVHTFSVRFAGPSSLDEAPYARLVAEHCGTDHQEVTLDSAALRQALPEVLQHLDEPFGDSSAVPMYLVSKAARANFTVALSGDGADEVFAGYRRYSLEHHLRRLGPYPLRRWLWRPLSSLLPTGRTTRLLEFNRRVRRTLESDAATAAERHINLLHMSLVDDEALLGRRLRPIGFAPLRGELLARLGERPDLNRRLLFDQNLVLRDDMFVKVDRMSMKVGLEVRSPFVDHRLVALANGLPPERKLQGVAGKRVLHERLGHLLPAAILKRPKTGIEMPLGAWLREDLAT